MLMRNHEIELGLEALMTAADHASRAIPPVWPLASSVAVNPYLGQTEPRPSVDSGPARTGGWRTRDNASALVSCEDHQPADSG